MNAQESLVAHDLQPTEQRDCKKSPIDAPALAAKLLKLTLVMVCKGKKLLTLDPQTDGDQILAEAIGRSGNLRAPTIQHGAVLLVGYNEEAYSRLPQLLGA